MKGIRVGFTGTRKGLSNNQTEVLSCIFRTGNNHITEFHHGMCVGADSDAHDIVEMRAFWGCKIIGHPPLDKKFYANKVCDEIRSPEPYLSRNKTIVNESDILIACPEGPEKLRSGTWATVRYARSRKRPITIIFPGGAIKHENQ